MRRDTRSRARAVVVLASAAALVAVSANVAGVRHLQVARSSGYAAPELPPSDTPRSLRLSFVDARQSWTPHRAPEEVRLARSRNGGPPRVSL
jgi:hypothetical protein